MQSARTLRSHIFIWTCGWRGITLLPHCTALHWLVCTCDLCLGQYLGHIILPTPTSRAESSRQCIFAYDWHPFRFSCIVFSGPPNAVNWPAAVAASPHIFTQTCAQSIEAPLAPPSPLPLFLLPIGISRAFIVRCAFAAADFGFICSLLAAVYVAFKWVIEQMDVRYACLPTYEYSYVLELELELIRCEPNRSCQSVAPASFALAVLYTVPVNVN